ncbi:hypothetical protein DQX05_18705 [Paenibacillus thiaminolyticus]|uniref:Uncharacterized protein n=1 Tax=Paenibacillus thiaminolyticus TaxID=49283 RepID=A0A3A3GW63_PANTH|nr:hypothetical protein DQX05_18705 [Paenibacillus thiaminolyticus]
MLPCDNNGISLIRVAASHNIRKSKKKRTVKEGIKLMLIGSLLGIAIWSRTSGGDYTIFF